MTTASAGLPTPRPVPGLIIGAPASGTGKTTLTLGLLAALRARGIAVAATKAGPDYIDPAFHAAATGRPSFNLDSWAMAPALIDGLVRRAADGAGLVVCEGLMGLFDGVASVGATGTGSTADLAARTGWPVLLVINARGQSQSAAALVKGFATYRPDVRIGGVVLNNVGSPRHQRLAGDAIEALGIPVLGGLPRDPDVVLPERHLGLVQASETPALARILDGLGRLVAANVDLDRVVALASGGVAPGALHGALPLPPLGQRLAVARDAAFTFAYPHVLDGWHGAGVELRVFSPLDDEPPPADADAVFLPGGYPELHAARLAAARTFLAGLRAAAAAGKPVYGECGGYMVLGESLEDAQGHTHAMANLFSLRTSFAKRKLHLGYRLGRLLADTPLGPAGTLLRGHEFHYATVVSGGIDDHLLDATAADGTSLGRLGSRRGSVAGSFMHAIATE